MRKLSRIIRYSLFFAVVFFYSLAIYSGSFASDDELNKTCHKSTSSPYVLKDDGIYKMWYTDQDCTTGEIGIYYAMSSDGIKWQRYTERPVVSAGRNVWSKERVGSPSVLKKDGVYHMWYRADGGGLQQIGYAESKDGVNWQRYDNPVLRVGKEYEWDSLSLVAPHVICIDSMFYMWYRGSQNPNQDESSIGLALSTDGINWERYKANPIVNIGDDGEWDDKQVGDPCVLYDSDSAIYKMWFSGVSFNYQEEVAVKFRTQKPQAGTGKSIGYATSKDGIIWKKFDHNPIILLPGKIKLFSRYWTVDRIDNPCVIKEKDLYKMWYRMKTRRASFIGYATSKDGITWSKPKRIKYITDN